jgi:hypothetical protein
MHTPCVVWQREQTGCWWSQANLDLRQASQAANRDAMTSGRGSRISGSGPPGTDSSSVFGYRRLGDKIVGEEGGSQ